MLATIDERQDLTHLRGEVRAIERAAQAAGFRRRYEAEPISAYVAAWVHALRREGAEQWPG